MPRSSLERGTSVDLYDNKEGWPSLRTRCNFACPQIPERTGPDTRMRILPRCHDTSHIPGTQISTKEDEDGRRKMYNQMALNLNGLIFAFFNLGRFHLKVRISSLSHKIRRSGNTRGSFWPGIFPLNIICPLTLVLQFAPIPTTP